MMKTASVFVLLSLSAPALAVQPSHWVHNTEADFKAGKFEGIVATNLGDLKLSRQVTTLLEQDPRIAAVYSMVEAPDGTIYAGTGAAGIVLRIAEGKIEPVLELEEGTSVFAVAVDRQGRLLVAASGNQGRVLRIDRPGAEPTQLLAPEGVQYIWALAQAEDGTIYAATGPTGELHQLNPDGTSKVLLKTDERNFLSLAYDGKETLYVGTDPNGLVYRVNRTTGELFVLYDAAESEIGALVVDAAGNVYAGASESVEGSMVAGMAGAGAGEMGRPETEGGGLPIPAQPPREPQPPELPDPNPSEPDPIPTTQPAAWRGMVAPAAAVAVAPTRLGPRPLVYLMAAAPATAPDAEPTHPDAEPPTAQPARGQQERATTAAAPPQARPQPPTEPRPEGNGIYRIDPEGFVTELFRGPVMVLDMIEQDGRLIVGTGSEGLVYQIDPRAEETLVLADLEPQQVMTLLPARDGRIYLGLANTGGIAAMSEGYAPVGTYTSPVLDAVQVARFGRIQLDGALPAGTSIQISTRSGNVREPGDREWSAWSEPADAVRFLPVSAPPARFLQYRVIMKTTAPDATPVLDSVDVAYQIPNLPPRIQGVTITPARAEADAPPAKHTIAWLAADPNSDALRYSLEYRLGSGGAWVPLKDDLTETTFEWNTRTLADGRYFIRVTATDARANALGQGKSAHRISDAVVIDNTPPVIGDLDWKQSPEGLEVALRVVDRTGTVRAVEYAVNSAEDWQAVLPSDTIYDSPAETVKFIIPDLKAGSHQVSIRATDAAGNRSFETVQVKVEATAPTTQPIRDR